MRKKSKYEMARENWLAGGQQDESEIPAESISAPSPTVGHVGEDAIRRFNETMAARKGG